MGRVFRQQYTRPIPADAERVTIKNKKGESVPAVRFKGSDGKTITAPVTLKGKNAGTHCRVKSPTWYGKVKGVPVPLCTNKEASEVMLSDKIREAAQNQAGMVNPFKSHHKNPLTEHLADFQKHLEAKDRDPRHVEQVVSFVRALLDGCGFTRLDDLSLAKAQAWLTGLRKDAPFSLPAGKEAFPLKEAAELLHIGEPTLAALVKRRGLADAVPGRGRKRVFPRGVLEALMQDRSRGASAGTVNHYIAAVRSFCRWLVRPGKRLAVNPLEGLELLNAEADVRHARRELTADELRRVLTAAKASSQSWRGLTGNDRFHLYATACGTGFRSGGLGSLLPVCFELDKTPPTVTLSVKGDKSRRGKIQPLPDDVAELLRAYLVGKPADQPVWPGPWAKDRTAAAMLRIDLAAAGVPYEVQGPDGPMYADFHALRHTYLTLGGRAGIDLRTLQELAGHSTSKLTERYTHVRLHDLAGAVDKMPSFLPTLPADEAASMKATGTEGANPGRAGWSDRLHAAYTGERWR